METVVDRLEILLQGSKNPGLRDIAAIGLTRLGQDPHLSWRELWNALEKETDPLVRETLLFCLNQLSDSVGHPQLSLKATQALAAILKTLEEHAPIAGSLSELLAKSPPIEDPDLIVALDKAGRKTWNRRIQGNIQKALTQVLAKNPNAIALAEAEILFNDYPPEAKKRAEGILGRIFRVCAEKIGVKK
jgi:hypothetical protein